MPTPAAAADGSSPQQRKFSEPFEMALDPLQELPGHDRDQPRHDGRPPELERRAADGQQLRQPGPPPLLRRPGVPPHHPRVHDPGRLPRGLGSWWPGLPLRRRAAGPRSLQGRLAGHGQRRSEHQRQPVLHHLRCARRAAAAAVLAVRPARSRARTCSPRSRRFRPTAPIVRARTCGSSRSPSPRADAAHRVTLRRTTRRLLVLALAGGVTAAAVVGVRRARAQGLLSSHRARRTAELARVGAATGSNYVSMKARGCPCLRRASRRAAGRVRAADRRAGRGDPRRHEGRADEAGPDGQLPRSGSARAGARGARTAAERRASHGVRAGATGRGRGARRRSRRGVRPVRPTTHRLRLDRSGAPGPDPSRASRSRSRSSTRVSTRRSRPTWRTPTCSSR